VSTPSAIVLYAPAAIRHDRLPDTATSARILPGCADGIQAGANTIIVPGRLVPATEPDPAGRSSLQPVFLLRPAKAGSCLPYTLMSYTGDDLLYIRLPGPAVRGTPGSAACRVRWAADLPARHRAHGGQLNNHACWRCNLLPGLEAEHKITLPADVDIWDLAVTTHQHVRAGALKGWICEHGNDGGFTQGDFTSHLFAITSPASERGYIAFMPAIDGPGYCIRRKRYPRDQTLRREDLTHAPELTADPAAFPRSSATGTASPPHGVPPTAASATTSCSKASKPVTSSRSCTTGAPPNTPPTSSKPKSNTSAAGPSAPAADARYSASSPNSQPGPEICRPATASPTQKTRSPN
jgi:hypothetical protein